MTFHSMSRRLLRTILMQRKFISKSMKIDQEIALYNEKPQRSKSLVVRFPGPVSEMIEVNKFTNLRSDSNSRSFFLFNNNYVVICKGSDKVKVPVGEEGIEVEEKIPAIRISDLIRWFAKSKDSGEGRDSVRSTGGAIGRLDAANEAGFFHRTDRSRLQDIKKKLKDKEKSDPTEPKKTS